MIVEAAAKIAFQGCLTNNLNLKTTRLWYFTGAAGKFPSGDKIHGCWKQEMVGRIPFYKYKLQQYLSARVNWRQASTLQNWAIAANGKNILPALICWSMWASVFYLGYCLICYRQIKYKDHVQEMSRQKEAISRVNPFMMGKYAIKLSSMEIKNIKILQISCLFWH